MGTNGTYFHVFPDSDNQNPMATAFISPAFRQLAMTIRAFVGQNKGGFRHLILNFNKLDRGGQIMRLADIQHGAGNHTLSVVSPTVPDGDPINCSVKISVTTNDNESQPFALLYAGQGNNVTLENIFADVDKDTIANPQPDQGEGNDGLWLTADALFKIFDGLGPPHGEPGLVPYVNIRNKTVFKGFGFRRDYFFDFEAGEAAFIMRNWWDGPDTFATFAIPSDNKAALTLILPFEAFNAATRPELHVNWAIRQTASTINLVPIGTPVEVSPGDTITIVGTDLMTTELPKIDVGLTRDVVGPNPCLVTAEPGATSTSADFVIPATGRSGLTSICLVRQELGGDGGHYTADLIDALDIRTGSDRKFNRNLNRKFNGNFN